MELQTPFLDILPPLSTEEFQALKADIEANGVQIPIAIDEDGNILDGHHRYKIDPEAPTTTVTGLTHAEKVAYILRSNMTRRNLSPDQKKELREAMKATAQELAELGYTQQAVGDLLGVAQRTVSGWLEATNSDTANGCKPDSRVVIPKTADPDILERLDSGETQEQVASDYGVTRQGLAKRVQVARRKLKHSQLPDPPPLPRDKYSVVYADPPWCYGDKLVDGYGAAEHHYPSMTISELCDMPIANLLHDNAVLFLWVTSPLLEECFDVIRAWGFKYKASFVWDKVRHNYGHYNSVRHEFLLVCTRGSFLPQNKELHDSVIELDRTEIHSQKPEYMRELIGAMYPEGRRLELFARGAVAGWDTWGNEA